MTERDRAPLLAVAGLVLALVATVMAPGVSRADPPTQLDCLPLVAGTTGVIGIGDMLPSSATLTGKPGGFGAVAPATVQASLPRRIVFKDQTTTYDTRYGFALRSGRLYVRRSKAGAPIPGEPWHLMQLPGCLDGQVSAISDDQGFLLALGPDRQVYSLSRPNGDLSPEGWTWRWGPYFWTGSGVKMFGDVRRWAASTFGSGETFTDTSGRSQHPIGVGTVYLLRDGGRRITYLDPWLPQDESREVCTPRRGTLPLANLSASGSTVFAVGQRGELFTRLYDFDVSGANTVFGNYSWQSPRPASDTRWQLPGPSWRRQPAPAGRITDRITIVTTGTDAANRLLVVEGRNRHGRAGRFEKSITARTWRFVPTGQRLRGRALPLRTPLPYGAVDARRYLGTIGGRPAAVTDFGPECSPAHLTIDFGAGVRLNLLLHSTDGMRQEIRARGLNDVPRNYNGAIEIPRATFDRLPGMPAPVRAWVAANLSPGRFTTSPIAVTSTRLRSLAQCWQLTLDGRPARPDQLAVPPDPGAIVGLLAEMAKDQRPPSICP